MQRHYSTKFLLVIPILVTMGLIQCTGSTQSSDIIVIDDLSKSYQQMLLSDEPPPKNNIGFSVKGEADGTYVVAGIELPAGRIDTTFLLDWYSDTLIFRYRPITAKKGKLEIGYDF